MRLTTLDIWRMVMRSFFLQTLWNFRQMQNLGWLYSIWPALRRIYPAGEARRAAAMNHIDYFNTHPYMANLILGVVAGLEEEKAAGRATDAQVRSAKQFMSGPLAALGDTVFWGVLRPLAAVVAIFLAWRFFPGFWWAAPVFFLVLYNVVHLPMRVVGLLVGYRRKTQVISFLGRLNLQKIAEAAYLAGLVTALLAILPIVASFGEGLWAALGLVALGMLGMYFRLSATRMFYAVTAVVVALFYLRDSLS